MELSDVRIYISEDCKRSIFLICGDHYLNLSCRAVTDYLLASTAGSKEYLYLEILFNVITIFHSFSLGRFRTRNRFDIHKMRFLWQTQSQENECAYFTSIFSILQMLIFL